MTYWAEIHEGLVRRVTELTSGTDGDQQDWLVSNLGGIWVKSSSDYYPRKNFAVVGYTLADDGESFISPAPFPSWVWNEEAWSWQPPTPRPEGVASFIWNEQTLDWVEVV